MSATTSKKRKTTTGTPAQITSPSAYLIQSYSRHDSYDTREYKTHAIFSNAAAANEAARHMFNREGPNYEPVTKANLAKASMSGTLMVGADDDDDGDDDDDVVEVTVDDFGAVIIDIGEDVGESEELKVWVTRFGMDEMPREK